MRNNNIVLPSRALVGSVNTARAGQGEYLMAGHNFHVRFGEAKWGAKPSQPGSEGYEYFAIQMEILASDCPSQGKGKKPSYFIKMDGELGQGHLGEFLRHALTNLAARENMKLDVENDDYWKEIIDYDLICEVVGKDQILTNVELFVATRGITTGKGKQFTVHDWFLEPQVQMLY